MHQKVPLFQPFLLQGLPELKGGAERDVWKVLEPLQREAPKAPFQRMIYVQFFADRRNLCLSLQQVSSTPGPSFGIF